MIAPLVLVDGSSYLYRAFHALPPLMTANGQPTGAVRGVVSMLQKLQQAVQPTHMAVVFDAPGKTFRDDLYAEYKSHRPPMPDDLRAQVEPLYAVIRALGLPLLIVDGVEADDVIGTLARQAEAQGLPVLISTGDKDMAQLVNERISLINTMTDTTMGPDGVVAKFGVRPDQIIDYLTLVGDSVDNIPGVPGVGPKTAAKWLQEYGSFDALRAQADAIKGKAGENLRATLPQLELSRQLATIHCAVPLPLTVAELTPQAPDRDALREWYRQLEFKSWLAEVEAGEVAEAPAVAHPEVSYHTVLEQADFDDLLARLRAAGRCCVDTETDSLDYLEARIVGVSFAVEPFEAWYIPLAHDYLGAPAQLDRDAALAALKPILEDPAIEKTGQHLKYDTHVFANHGIALRGIGFDTMLASYCLDPTGTRHNMDDMAKLYLDYSTVTFEDIAGKGVKQLRFNQIDLDTAGFYAAEDADITLRLRRALEPKLAELPALDRLFRELELPLAGILQRMERRGVLIDRKALQAQSVALGAALRELEQQAWAVAGEDFNLSSPKQLGQILYEKLAIPAPKKTATGQYSTAEDVLEQLAAEYELPRLVLAHRSLNKLKGTYTDKLPELVNSRSGRLHTSYHQAVAATGRLSSSDPNLQNIPVRTPEGRRIRQAFVAAPGYKLISADYSQIELRIMAHLSADPGLLAAFAHGEDVHRATAAEVFGVPLTEVSAEQRRNAKAINFGLIYGMSAFGLAKQLGLGRNEAQGYIDSYFTRYPGVKAYMENIRGQAAQHGFVETLFGRRLYVRSINSRNPNERQAAERAAINAPLQGTAADIIKRAMLAVDAALAAAQLDAAIVLQVHDELVLEVHADQVDAVSALVRERMMAAADLAVPLLVDVGVGANWDEAH